MKLMINDLSKMLNLPITELPSGPNALFETINENGKLATFKKKIENTINLPNARRSLWYRKFAK